MSALVTVSIIISAVLMVISALLILIRLMLGPSLPDRVVGLDMLTLSLVAFCALATLYFEQRAFLDVALVLALIGFLATVALARFAERVQDNDRKNGEDHD
ncbi:MAG: cation:proton antiporter [Rhodobacteraceae bacterium]|nr:cation:proton antiporter [Paracoccaceae bacterium]